MGLAITIIIIQFAIIGWLSYPRIKPKAVDYWAKADEMVQRLNRSDSENWVHDFKKLQGLPVEEPTPAKPVHTIAKKWTAVYYGFEKVYFKCSCGFEDSTHYATLLHSKFDEHVAKQRMIES